MSSLISQCCCIGPYSRVPQPNPCNRPNSPSKDCHVDAGLEPVAILSHNPTKVLVLIPYQHPICSATKPLPLQSWRHFDAKFHTLAAVNPCFCWDQRHPDLWLECLIRSSNAGHASYCKATTHSQTTVLNHLFVIANQLICHLNLKIPSTYMWQVQPRSLHQNHLLLPTHLPILSKQPPSNQLPQKPK